MRTLLIQDLSRDLVDDKWSYTNFGALSGIGIKIWRPKSSPIGGDEEVKQEQPVLNSYLERTEIDSNLNIMLWFSFEATIWKAFDDRWCSWLAVSVHWPIEQTQNYQLLLFADCISY